MKQFILFLSLVMLPALASSQQTINATIRHDGVTRDYILYVPANYDVNTPVPLLFNFHGYTSNATQQMFYGDFRPIADTAGFIIAHPEGLVDLLGNTHFNVGWGGSAVDDVGFASALIDSISSQYSIDLDRVYSTGMSNGGFMSYELACQLSDRMAAVASVTGSMSPVTYTNCNPQHPMPILEIHGTADPTVSYTGSAIARSIDDVLAYWVNYNQCESTATSLELPDINTQDGSTVTHFIWEQGDQGVTVEHLRVENGGHRWPGTAFDQPGTNYDINASVEVWNFFSKFDINGLIDGTSSVEVINSGENISLYPNPIKNNLTIERLAKSESTYEILSMTGAVIMKGQLRSAITELNLDHMSQGVYLLKIGGRSTKLIKM